MKWILLLLFVSVAHAQGYQVASYASQSSSGSPLIVNGVIDTAKVKDLAKFDIITMEATPWAKDINGFSRTDVPQLLRHYNPDIKIYLYVLTGDQWLPPGFNVQSWDHSAFADIYHAVDLTNGWLYGTDGQVWITNYRVNLGKTLTISALTTTLVSLVKTRLFDGMFLDCCSSSISWTNGSGGRFLDYTRAGFTSLGDMDSSRANNIQGLIESLHEAGGCDFLVALNGTGTKPVGLDIDFREGLGSIISIQDASNWMQTPGQHWLMADSYGMCNYWSPILQSIANTYGHGEAIITCGPGRDSPQYLIPH